MATPGFLSKRVKKKPRSGITSDRYEFLGLDQAEPDLGDPLVGPSSIGANPAPLSGSQYVLVASGENTGKRYWVNTTNLTSTGLIPGSFTVYNNNIQVGLANSFNKFNFVGSGVTVDPVGYTNSEQTGIATVRITVTDLTAPGDINTIPYHSNSGFLDGAPDFVYNSGFIGIGTTNPSSKLDIVGDIKSSGSVTSSSFVGNLSGTATTATNLADAANITTGTISSSRLSGSYGISITGTATNVSNNININTSGIITATTFYGNLIGSISTTGQSFETIVVTGLSTFTNGPVLIGTGNLTGTASQPLQVTGGAYVSGNVGLGTTIPLSNLHVVGGVYVTDNLGIGTTNPTSKLHVVGNINSTGILTASSGNFSGIVTSSGLSISGVSTLGIVTSGNIYSTGIITASSGNFSGIVTSSELSISGISTLGIVTSGNIYSTGIVTSNGFNANTGNDYKINNTSVLTSTTLGSGVINSSLTSVGTLTNLSVGNINSTGILTATSGNFSGIVTSSGLNVTGLSTFTNGPVLIGSTTSTGTANQTLQVTGGAYVSGNVGIGTTNPTSKLHVIGDVRISGVTTSTDFDSLSDSNLKTNVQIIENSLEKVIQIRGVTFDWKENNRSSAGVIAQEVEKVLPELVNNENPKTVNYNGITATLIEAIKELKLENDILKEKIEEIYQKVFE